jgi:hypothetical protein
MASPRDDAICGDGSIRARGLAECRGFLGQGFHARTGDAMSLAIGIAAVLILAGLVVICAGIGGKR